MHEHGTKTTSVFLSADGAGSWLLLPSSSPYYQAAKCNQKTPTPVSSRLQLRSKKVKTGASTLITSTASVHLPKPASADLTIKPGSVVTNPIAKDGA